MSLCAIVWQWQLISNLALSLRQLGTDMTLCLAFYGIKYNYIFTLSYDYFADVTVHVCLLDAKKSCLKVFDCSRKMEGMSK